eukprot:CAMPEP_0115885958 /NCGR_PEP_ID=MMETSP0287-20121206/30954_1 /TAXON_ID=412157 /ORGANISM="Chrysochromulina rotalis, Strain UIO044" /LENGTH=167 /DNA_ID=CAMNT_0003342415 /DNA_START=33 /DNA_END=533 /DNA_ORIENTATION=+
MPPQVIEVYAPKGHAVPPTSEIDAAPSKYVPHHYPTLDDHARSRLLDGCIPMMASLPIASLVAPQVESACAPVVTAPDRTATAPVTIPAALVPVRLYVPRGHAAPPHEICDTEVTAEVASSQPVSSRALRSSYSQLVGYAKDCKRRWATMATSFYPGGGENDKTHVA